MDSVRIDKYLWAIRVFKTRTEASEAGVYYTNRVTGLIEKRVGAQLVPQYAENLTPQSELDKLKAPVETFFVKRDRGTGRPTKKDRRTIEAMWDGIDFNDDFPEESGDGLDD